MLRLARQKTFRIGPSQIVAQNNPARVSSAAANIDPEAMRNRGCVLCPDKLPTEQHRIPCGDKWIVLCNPAPLFEPHFTIIATEHQPQQLDGVITDVLDVSQQLGENYTLFYNGPTSGASLPDHLHLQASRSGATPFDDELSEELSRRDHPAHDSWLTWIKDKPAQIALTTPPCRPAIVVTACEKSAVQQGLAEVLAALGEVRPARPEPKCNLFATYRDQTWITWLFPRQARRPAIYGQGEEDFLISPGAVDVAGLLVVPREHDFDRLTDTIIDQIYKDVLLDADSFDQLASLLSSKS
jgi:ATP adenylyltransferase/5',5'''-P-1,P-4-tetraphosphate phosphorylase II